MRPRITIPENQTTEIADEIARDVFRRLLRFCHKIEHEPSTDQAAPAIDEAAEKIFADALIRVRVMNYW